MSTASKLTLLCTTVGAVSIVVLVHYQQKAEKAAMHAGVVRDFERQKQQRERALEFQMQQDLETEYRKVQSVSANGQDTS